MDELIDYLRRELAAAIAAGDDDRRDAMRRFLAALQTPEAGLSVGEIARPSRVES